MTPALARFVEALRAEGIAVAPSELLDAARALDTVDLGDRARVRGALRATLVKSRRGLVPFDRVFDRFFAPPRRPPADGEGKRAGAAGPGRASTPVPARDAGGLPRRARRVEPEADRPRRAGPPRASSLPAGRRREGPRIVRASPTRKETGARPAASGASLSPLERDLSAPATTEGEREIARLVPRLLEQLRLRTGRRLRRGRRGRLWSSRVLRENLAHGGIPFVLPLRSPKPRRTRVVLLVDVSYSVARAAGYFLWMASEFVRIGRDARVVAFVDRPVDATEAVRRWLARGGAGGREARVDEAERRGQGRGRLPGSGIAPEGRPFDGLLRSLRGLNLEAPSDYGRALHALLHSSLRPGGRDTVLVVLGDGRTNRFDPLAWTLEELGRRCRALLWLVPEPRSRWGSADSALDAYLPWVDVAVESHDLEGLARGLAELLRTL